MRKILSFISVILVSFGCLIGCSTSDDSAINDETEEDIYTPFSVMSFNIRNDANPNDPQSLEIRKSHILSTIIENSPDVVGLQEFSDDWFEEWMNKEMLSHGYSSYNDPIAGRGSPKAIYFKRERFELLEKATFEMFFTEGRTGTWVVLHDKDNDRDYFISNSHWTTASSEDRVKSANKIVAEIKSNYKGLPLIVFGDFNARPGTPEIEVLKTASFLNLMNVDPDFEETFNGWKDGGISKLDWIFYSTTSFELENKIVVKNSYDGFWPSDHWPLMATFKLIEEQP